MPDMNVSRKDVENYSYHCSGMALDSELCLAGVKRGLIHDQVTQCRSEVRLGVRDWQPPDDLQKCRIEQACCQEAKKHALEDCDKAVRQAIHQCK